jgi:SAM-dependent methyltransferase
MTPRIRAGVPARGGNGWWRIEAYGERPTGGSAMVATGVDLEAGPGVDIVADLEEPVALGLFAHIDCVSVLEHSRRPWLLAANLERLLQPGGTLFVEAPFVWRIHSYPSDYWRFTVEGVRLLFPHIVWDRLELIHGGPQAKLPARREDGLLYFARGEVFGFGRCAC